MAEPVNFENFARAETDRMMAALVQQAGGVNRWHHVRTPTPLDQQTIIRMNRDTLYSLAIVDLTADATLTLPDAEGRYLSAMVINRDHYANAVLHRPGEHRLTRDELGTDFVTVGVRILVDPNDPADVAAVNRLQDELGVEAPAARAFVSPEYDQETLASTRDALQQLGQGLQRYDRAFGRREDVDPVRHLVGTAVGWAGLPETEAFYLNVEPNLPVGEYSLTVGDVPVDGFWSISLYDRDGFFPQGRGRVSINDITSERNDDGTVTVHFGGEENRPNRLPTVDGWNYTVRLYRPRQQVLDGSWRFPTVS